MKKIMMKHGETMRKHGEDHDETMRFKMIFSRELFQGESSCFCFFVFWGCGSDFGGSLPKHQICLRCPVMG